MRPLSDTQIDNLCEQFETCWCIDSAGADGIIAFIKSHELNCRVGRGTVVNLVEIDIERIWMSWDRKLADTSLQTDANELVRAFHSLPKFSSYENLFRDFCEIEAVRFKLAVCESRCRDQWGDAIGSYYYSQGYGLSIPANLNFKPRMLRCEFDGQRETPAPTFPLRGHNVIGRRRSFDAADCFVEELQHGNRIVLAGLAEASISREQLSIQLLSPKFTVVSNLSKVNPLRVCSVADLAPGESVVVGYPFAIRLPGRKLHCY